MNEDFVKQMWSVTKNIMAIVEQQQKQLAILSRSHFVLVDALRSESGLESDATARLIDQRSVEQAKGDVAELERLFTLGNGSVA